MNSKNKKKKKKNKKKKKKEKNCECGMTWGKNSMEKIVGGTEVAKPWEYPWQVRRNFINTKLIQKLRHCRNGSLVLKTKYKFFPQ